MQNVNDHWRDKSHFHHHGKMYKHFTKQSTEKTGESVNPRAGKCGKAADCHDRAFFPDTDQSDLL